MDQVGTKVGMKPSATPVIARRPRASSRFAPVFLSLIFAAALAGCSQSPGPILAGAVSRAYPGHADLQPKISVGADDSSFPFTPGTLIFASATDSEGTGWIAQTDIRCGHSGALSRFRSEPLRPYVIGGGAAVAAREHARRWLSTTTGLSDAAINGVASLRISLTNVRRIAASRVALEGLRREAAAGCPLAAVGGGLRTVKSVLIGDVKVEVRFERHLSLGARLALLDALQISFGVGYQRVSDRAIAGRQVAFGIRWE